MKTVAFSLQKGGSGKTSVAVSVAAEFARLGDTLLVDADPQGNATTGYGIAKRTLTSTTYEVLMGDVRPAEAIIPTNFKNVDILPSTQLLAEAEVRLLQFENKTLQLKKALLQIKDNYDVIIIDCLPSLGVLALLPVETDNIVKDIVEAQAFLRTQKGFGSFSVTKQELLLYTAAIVASEYAEDVKSGVVTASISTSIASIIIAQQTAMIAAMSASAAVAASSSN